MITALLDLGYWDDRLESALEWMARSVTGEGVAPMGTTGTPDTLLLRQDWAGFCLRGEQ